MARRIIRILNGDRFVRDADGWVSDSFFAVCPALANGLVKPMQEGRELEWKESLRSFRVFDATVERNTELVAIREGNSYRYEGGLVQVKSKYDEVLAPFAATITVASSRIIPNSKIVVYRDLVGSPIAICIATVVPEESIGL